MGMKVLKIAKNAEMQAGFRRHIDRLALFNQCCQSPIEIVLASVVGLMFDAEVRGPIRARCAQPGLELYEGLTIVPQWPVDRYTADFLFAMVLPGKPPVQVLVECDGHDYHERTKKQAAHDRSRDRFMSLQGLRVLRFTGSEIHAAPDKCAREVLVHLGVMARG